MTIDFKTGKTISSRDNLIVIGLPYNLRIEGKTRDLIDMIWKIENNQLKIQEINTNSLTNEKGEIDKAKEEKDKISGTENEIPQNAIIIDEGNSFSSQRQQRELRNLASEQAMRPNFETEIEDNNEDENEPAIRDTINELRELVTSRRLATNTSH